MSEEPTTRAGRRDDPEAQAARRVRRLVASLHHAGPRPDDGLEPGPIERLFWEGEGPTVHKWHHYMPLYDRYFAPFRALPGGRPVRLLEIGVFQGGSLWMWRRFFGPDAVIAGIDVDPRCAGLDGREGMVRIGSQDDPEFVAGVVDEMGGIDILLDDGSHDSRHMCATLGILFPRLAQGGLYVIEDAHAAYWPDLSGGYDAPQGLMADVKRMIDDMHHWYHDRGEVVAATAGQLAGLHVHDSVIVLEKRAAVAPKHTIRPGGSEAPEAEAGPSALWR